MLAAGAVKYDSRPIQVDRQPTLLNKTQIIKK